MSADPIRDLRQCEEEIARCAAYEGPDEVGAAMGWADAQIERGYILREISAKPFQILCGDAVEILRALPDSSVNCCITSPPYYGLRDYGVSGQIGLEATPEEYIQRLVAVFREVRRVLREDGTLWVNIGDSYAANRSYQVTPSKWKSLEFGESNATKVPDGLKPKDLIGIPWMLAFALRTDGWWLRQDIIWHKPNPMPESVKDRCTKAHEYLFLLTKSPRYRYDADAVAESGAGRETYFGSDRYSEGSGRNDSGQYDNTVCTTRNRRSVWTLAALPTPEAHFATFPIELPETCLRAGCPPEGKRCDCGEVIETPLGAGAIIDPSLETGRAGMNRPRRDGEGTRPITRQEQRDYARQMRESPYRAEMEAAAGEAFAHYIRTDRSGARPLPPSLLCAWLDRGWLKASEPCTCPVEPAGIVLDPFSGAGTTGLACLKNGRRYLGIEINPRYVEMSYQRARKYYPLLVEGAA